MEHKMGVIRTLKHRVNPIITEEEDKEEEIKHIKKVLRIVDYSKWVWQAPGRKKLHPHPNYRNHTRPKGHVTIPYVQGITEPISRFIRKAGVTAHTKPHTTISKLLAPEGKCGVIYHLTCQDCYAQYVGETERALKHRLKEHSRDSSPVGHHMGFHQHKLDTDNIKILDRESRWFQRGVREALQIRSRSPSLNRDRGRHQLPPPTIPLSSLVMQVRPLEHHVTTFRAEEKWRMPFESFSLSNFISVSSWYKFTLTL